MSDISEFFKVGEVSQRLERNMFNQLGPFSLAETKEIEWKHPSFLLHDIRRIEFLGKDILFCECEILVNQRILLAQTPIAAFNYRQLWSPIRIDRGSVTLFKLYTPNRLVVNHNPDDYKFYLNFNGVEYI